MVKKPFHEIDKIPDVVTAIINGIRPSPIPNDIPYKDIMEHCWTQNRKERPDMRDTSLKLYQLCPTTSRKHKKHASNQRANTDDINNTSVPSTPASATMTKEQIVVGEKTLQEVIKLHEEAKAKNDASKYAEAFAYFKKLADKQTNELNPTGDTSDTIEAKFYVGHYLLEGHGTEKDEVEAIPYLAEAAKAGKAQAQFVYGRALLKGNPDLYNENDGVKYLHDAVRQGYQPALVLWGDIHFQGEHGVPMEKKKAYDIYKKAADMGSPTAKSRLEAFKKPKS